MPEMKRKFPVFQKSHLQTVGILVLILLAALLLLFNSIHSTQATSALTAQVRFEGEYRIGDGPWQPIREGQHIPASKGDVTLRGNFHMLTPFGEYVGIYDGDLPIALYTNHILLTVTEADMEPWTLDTENPLYGQSACGVQWNAYVLCGNRQEPLEILVHNPHAFGNETAIDEMLSSMAIWAGIDFERDRMGSGESQRNTGLFFLMVSLVMLGSALFSALLHIPNNRTIWLLGATILSAGVYLAYSAPGVVFWSEFIAVNTSLLGFSMMFYMLFVSAIVTSLLRKHKKIGYIVTASLGVAVGIFFLLPVLADVYFYDTWLPWVLVQTAANIVLLICVARESKTYSLKEFWPRLGMALLVIAFEADVIATATGFWLGGKLSK